MSDLNHMSRDELVQQVLREQALRADLLAVAKAVYHWMNGLPIPTAGCTAKGQLLYDAIAKADGHSRAMLASAPAPHPLAKHMPSRDMLRNKIASDPDDEGIGVAPAPDTKQEPVAVKPVKWMHFEAIGPGSPEQWFAHDDLGGTLTVTSDPTYAPLPWVARPFPPGPSNYATADEAKAVLEEQRDARIRSALFPSPVTQKVSEAWQPIETARKVVDETVLLRIEHVNYAIATPDDKHRWQEIVSAYWTDFNGGGWVWHGLAGEPTHWCPIPPLPAQEKSE